MRQKSVYETRVYSVRMNHEQYEKFRKKAEIKEIRRVYE